jgi:photosystem II stability/assembly factor-like uncharacterized protein
MNKLLFTVLILISTQQNYPQEFWERLESPVNAKLNSVFFIDSITGWAAGDSGTIIYTTDGADSWTIQNSSIFHNIEDIFFISPSKGIALAWKTDSAPFGTIILRTTNAGIDWASEFYRQEDKFLFTVYFIDSLRGWIGGKTGDFLQTTDGGLNWEPANIDTGLGGGFPPLSFSFYNDQYGFACGGQIDIAGVIWRTIDSAKSWQPQIIGPEPIVQMHFVDSSNVIGIGGDFEYGSSVITTTDGGNNWNYTSLSIFGVPFSLSFRTPSEAWAPLGAKGTLIFTTDTAQTWTEIFAPDSCKIFNLMFADSTHGYAVGDSGSIIRYVPKVVNEINLREDLKRPGFFLEQNYPNPFNPVTKIMYRIPISDTPRNSSLPVKLKVYDLMGNEIATLVNEVKQPGAYEVSFNAGNLAGGVYFYKIIAGELTDTKKMILLK